MDTLQSVRHALRILAKRPAFTAVASLTIALGVGANTAIFSVVNEVFLRGPQVRDAGRLVALGRVTPDRGYQGFGHLAFLKYREQARSFTGLLAKRGATLLWHQGEQTVPLDGELVTANYFALLGVVIAPGRDFLPEEDSTPGAHPVAIVSHELWRTRLGADPAAIGRQIRLNDTWFTIVGVAPAGFRGLELGDAMDVWLPLMMEVEARPMFPVLNSDFFTSLRVVGRLRAGVSRAQAVTELTVLSSRFERRDAQGQGPRVVLTPHVRFPDPEFRRYAVTVLTPLAAAATLVLLIVAANLAGLLLARSASRKREIAVRLALGAGRARLVRQLLGESVLLAVPGALAGLLVSVWLTALIRAEAGAELHFGVDLRVLLFAGLVAVLTCVAFGLVPALHATRGDLVADLKDQGASTRRRSWLRDALVAGQVGVSLVLLAGAGLFVRTLQKAAALDVGFETRHLLQFQINLGQAGYDEAGAREFQQRLTERLLALPGVRAVSLASAAPVNRGFWGPRDIEVEGQGPAPGSRGIPVEYNEITPRYFETLGLSLSRGRDFTAADDARAPAVAVVNETAARQFWPGADPIGRTVRLVRFMGLSDPVEIVGVVPDVRIVVQDERPRPELTVPLAQHFHREPTTVLVRVAGGTERVAAALPGELRQLGPGLPPVAVESAARWVARQFSDQRLYAKLVGLFGALAVLLAAIGVYGTLALDVSQRTREIGVRMALGAPARAVVWLVVRKVLGMALPGAAVGLAGSFVLMRFVRGLLYGVAPTDPAALGAAVCVLLAATLLAAWLPARRAARVDPVVALRYE